MAQAQTKRTDADFVTHSVERWVDEGGFVQCVSGPVATPLNHAPCETSTGREEEPANATFAEEEKILERLGAAVTMKWGTLPRKLQRELFDHATSLADSIDTVQFKGQIARYLHENKGGAFGSV